MSPEALRAELLNKLDEVGNGMSASDSRPDDMTPSQREEFERQQIHHDDEDPLENSGPASEPEIRPQPAAPPDAGSIKR